MPSYSHRHFTFMHAWLSFSLAPHRFAFVLYWLPLSSLPHPRPLSDKRAYAYAHVIGFKYA